MPTRQKTAVVYHVACSCGKVYVGQTKREFGTRLGKHEDKWEEPLTRAGHAKQGNAFTDHPKGPLHVIDFPNATILSQEQSDEIREVKEALLISKAGRRAIANENLGQRSAVNRNRGRVLDSCWAPLIQQLPERV